MTKAGINAVEGEYHAAVAQFLTAYGLSESAARVLALMYLARAPQLELTANDMVRILGLSRATIGNALTELEAGGLVVRNTTPGSKRAHYRTYRDEWEFFQAVVQQRRLRKMDNSLRMLRQALVEQKTSVKKDEPAERARAFMDAANAFRRWMHGLAELTRDEVEQYFGMTPEQIRGCLKRD